MFSYRNIHNKTNTCLKVTKKGESFKNMILVTLLYEIIYIKFRCFRVIMRTLHHTYFLKENNNNNIIKKTT